MTLTLTGEQVRELLPLLETRGSAVLVANVFPTGTGWELHAHAIPRDRRDAIRAERTGQLKLPRAGKPQSPL